MLLTRLDARHSYKSFISFFVFLIIFSTLKHLSNNMGGRKLVFFKTSHSVIANIKCSMQQLNVEASLSSASVASKKHGYVWEDKLELWLKVCFGVICPFFLQVMLLIRWNSCFIEYWHDSKFRSYALERANGWSVWKLMMHWHESHDTVPGVR